MRFTGRTAAAVLSAAAALAVGTGSAAAGTIAPGGALSATSTAAVFVRLAPFANTSCTLTLSGTLATSYALPLPASAGSVASFASTSCAGGATVTGLNAPALELTSLSGALPTPTGGTITLKNLTYEGALGIIRCTYVGDLPLVISNGGTTATTPGGSFVSAGCGGAVGSIGAGTFTLSAAQTIS